MLLPRKKQKWQSKTPKIRLEAVSEADPKDDFLVQLATHDPVAEVREAAAVKLADLDALDRLYAASDDPGIKDTAEARRNSLRIQLLKEEGSEEEHLRHLQNIKGSENLSEIASGAFHVSLRLAAIDRIDDPKILARIGLQQCGKQVAERLVSRLDKEDLLENLAAEGGNKTIRRLAQEKLQSLRPGSEGQEEQAREQHLLRILENAARLIEDPNLELAAQRFQELERECATCTSADTHHLQKEFERAKEMFRQKYSRQQSEEKARRREQEKIQAVMTELSKLIETMGSIPLLADQSHDATHDALAERFEELVSQLDQEKQAATRDRFAAADRRYRERKEIFQEEQQLLSELLSGLGELIHQTAEPAEQLAKAKELRARFEQRHWKEAQTDEFNKRLDTEYKKLKAAAGLPEKQQQETGATLENKSSAIVAELESLCGAEDMGKALKRFKELEEQWQAIAADWTVEGNDLLKKFRRNRARFLARHRDFLVLQDWRYWANRILKIQLIEEVEQLDALDDPGRVFDSLKKLQMRWKEIGPTSKKDSRTLWQRFHGLCNLQFERCKPFLEGQEKLRRQQIERWQAIAEQAESLADSSDWAETTKTLRDLQQETEQLSLVPFKVRQPYYSRFRKANNTFFERRRVYLNEQTDVRLQRLEQKIALCEQAEEIAEHPQDHTASDLKELQKKWKQIGAAARKDEQAAWRRFRGAFDRFFAWLDEQRAENLARKRALAEQARELVEQAQEADDLSSLTSKMKDLQQSWKEIGPVPNDQREPVWQAFRGHCDRFFSLRQKTFDDLHQQQIENRRQKENILEQIEKLAASVDDKSAAEEIKALQKSFFAIGPAPRREEQFLQSELKKTCNEYFQGRSRYFEELQGERRELLRQKESLLFELEKLVGITPKKRGRQQPQTLDLAAQLKLAMQSNFAMAERNSVQAVREEVNRIQKQWKALSPLPFRLENPLQQRFGAALDKFEHDNRTK
jgi:hypothetical protein